MSDEIPAEVPDLAVLGRFLELTDLLTPYAVRAAVTLGLPRAIAAGPGRVEDLAAASGIDAGALASLLDHLAERGLVARRDDGAHELTEVGALMLHPDAEFHLDLGGATAAMDRAWAGLAHTLRTGRAGYPEVHGRGFWDHLAADPALGADFDEYMRRVSTWTAAAAAADVWPSEGTVVDVGGGDGALLGDLLGRHAALRGVLVELPATATRATARFAAAGLADRVDVVEGSFFDPLPPGGDVYVLGQVLHDWPDDEAATILCRVADALAPTGRVVLVEQVIDRDRHDPFGARTDLLMRLLFASHERTRAEWEALAAAAGLRVEDVRPADGPRLLVVLRPAATGGA